MSTRATRIDTMIARMPAVERATLLTACVVQSQSRDWTMRVDWSRLRDPGDVTTVRRTTGKLLGLAYAPAASCVHQLIVEQLDGSLLCISAAHVLRVVALAAEPSGDYVIAGLPL